MSQHSSPFGAIRQQAEDGSEYWSARQLYKLLGYSTWQKFQVAIAQAKIACENSGQAVSDHFNMQVKMVTIGSGAREYRVKRLPIALIMKLAAKSAPRSRDLARPCQRIYQRRRKVLSRYNARNKNA